MKTKRKTKAEKGRQQHSPEPPPLELGEQVLPLSRLILYPLNAEIYGERSAEDVRKLADLIRHNPLGQVDPIALTREGVIFSGHTRRLALMLLRRKMALCKVHDVSFRDPCFKNLIVDCNFYRQKTPAQLLTEYLVSYSPEDTGQAYGYLREHREYKENQARCSGDYLDLSDYNREPKLGPDKYPMIAAVQRIIEANKQYGPMTARTIHYELLNDPPLINASKPGRYENTTECYKGLTNIVLKRMRLEGYISFDDIHDPTRTSKSWPTDVGVTGYIDRQVKSHLLANYWRDLMQGQLNHVEIVGEKNTVESSIKTVAMKYTIPYTLARGYSSLSPRHEMAQRFRASGKQNLVILFMSDFDPEGENIALSFAESMKHHFGITPLARKVCLTAEQVEERGLPPVMKAKSGSSRRKGFVEEHGENVHELEALPTAERARLLEEAILSVIDVNTFNAEVERERQESVTLDSIRKKLGPMLEEALKQKPN